MTTTMTMTKLELFAMSVPLLLLASSAMAQDPLTDPLTDEPSSPTAANQGSLIDVGLLTGISIRPNSIGTGADVTFGYGVGVGFHLEDLTNLPLRGEILFLSDAHGGGEGVEAVDVTTWQGELLALVGVDWVPLQKGNKRLGLELLVGPGLRLTSVSIRVNSSSEPAIETKALVGMVAGTYFGWGQWRLGMRVMGGYPRARILQVYLSAAYRF